MRKAVADVAKLSFLDILFDRVENLFLRDLDRQFQPQCSSIKFVEALCRRLTDLHLSIGPTRNLDNHVEHSLLLIGVQGDVMEWGQGYSILLNVDTMLQGIGGPILSDRISAADRE